MTREPRLQKLVDLVWMFKRRTVTGVRDRDEFGAWYALVDFQGAIGWCDFVGISDDYQRRAFDQRKICPSVRPLDDRVLLRPESFDTEIDRTLLQGFTLRDLQAVDVETAERQTALVGCGHSFMFGGCEVLKPSFGVGRIFGPGRRRDKNEAYQTIADPGKHLQCDVPPIDHATK